MNSFNNEIMDLLPGDTPRKKWQALKDLIAENSRAKGRIDFCKTQFESLLKDTSTHPVVMGWIRSIIETLNTPI
jgi:hypothetical protein